MTLFRSRLANYLDGPDATRIHRVRTSYRRLEVSYRLFPGDARTPAARRFFRTGKRFFRLNSELRDCDVIESRLAGWQSPHREALAQKLHQIRARQLKKSLRCAGSLCTFPPPQLSCDESVLASRLRKQANEHAQEIFPHTAAILADTVDVEHLHELRKHAKKLYYLLELDRSLINPQGMKMVRRFQRLTGRIHDCDVILAFLKKQSRSKRDFTDLTKSIVNFRNKNRNSLKKMLASPEWKRLLRKGLSS